MLYCILSRLSQTLAYTCMHVCVRACVCVLLYVAKASAGTPIKTEKAAGGSQVVGKVGVRGYQLWNSSREGRVLLLAYRSLVLNSEHDILIAPSCIFAVLTVNTFILRSAVVVYVAVSLHDFAGTGFKMMAFTIICWCVSMLVGVHILQFPAYYMLCLQEERRKLHITAEQKRRVHIRVSTQQSSILCFVCCDIMTGGVNLNVWLTL